MKIAIVSPGSSWILDSIARKTAEASPDSFVLATPKTLTDTVFQAGKRNDPFSGVFYWDAQSCYFPYFKGLMPDLLHVVAFTHVHADDPKTIREGILSADGIIHMAGRYETVFQQFYPSDRMTVLRPGEVASQFPMKKTKIGICQRGEHVGKGKDFLPAVCQALSPEVRAGIEFHFKGKGWYDHFEKPVFRGAEYFKDKPSGENYRPEEWFSGSYHGIDAHEYRSEDPLSYPPFYAKLDYLLIPSLWEGGPMSALEALVVGLPIISSDVGWMSELYPGNHIYNTGNVSSCCKVLNEIIGRKISRRAAVQGMSYKKYGEGVLAFFEKIGAMK